MSFKADPDSIRSMARKISDLADDAEQARTYAGQWVDIGYSEGRIFATIVEQAGAVREAVLANYRHLAKLADESGGELKAVADHYRDTDLAEQRRIDAAYDES